MPRHDVRMSPAEVAGFLQAEEAGVLARLDGNGDPTAMLVASHGTGTGLALTPATAHPLPGDGTEVCVVYEREPSYSGVRAALVFGSLTGGRLVPDRTVGFDFGKVPPPGRAEGDR